LAKKPNVRSPKSAACPSHPSRPSRVAAQQDDERPVLLITAGPTHEPIDAVRFIGNRSSGKLGVALAEAAVECGWKVVLLMGPTAIPLPEHKLVTVQRFVTTDDLAKLLKKHQPSADAMAMAAAVADFRPAKTTKADSAGKIKRTAAGLTLKLESTPDLLAGCSARRDKEGFSQVLVGFALESKAKLAASAKDKLQRKGVDAVVANELGTMESESITASVFGADGSVTKTPGNMSKRAFGSWLMDIIEMLVMERAIATQHDAEDEACGCAECAG